MAAFIFFTKVLIQIILYREIWWYTSIKEVLPA